MPNPVNHVATLGHVRHQSALEVPVRQSRDLFQKRLPQPCFQPPSHAQQGSGDRQFHKQKHQQYTNRRQALSGKPQLPAQIKQPAKKNRLQNHATRREQGSEEQQRRGKHSVRPQQSQQLSSRTRRSLAQSRRNFGRNLRGLPRVTQRSLREPPAYTQQDRALQL